MLVIASPVDGSAVSSSTQTVVGTATDSLSGLSSLSCNGTPAPLSSGAFSCNISLNVGVNLIVVRATDLAGNIAGSNFHVSLGGMLPAPQSIQITPASANLLVGGTQAFTAVDQLGRPRSDATWTVSDATVATISSDSSPLLTGVAVGQVTLTATVQSASAQIQVNILGGASLPAGTLLWSAPAIPGFTSTQIIQAEPVDGGPDLYSIAINPDTKDTVINALTGEGQQQWSQTFPGTRLSSIADGNGGILLTYYSPNGSYTRVVDLDAQTGAPVWENDSTFLSGSASNFAAAESVAPDGTILVQSYTTFALDPNTGAAAKLQPANTPEGFLTYWDYCGGPIHTVPYPYAVTSQDGIGASLAADGTIFQVVSSLDLTFLTNCSSDPTSISEKLYLSRTAPDGSATFTAFDTETSLVPDSDSFPTFVRVPGCNDCSPGAFPPNTHVPGNVPFRVVPDGQGGAFIPWWKDLGNFPNYQAHLAHVSGPAVTDVILPLVFQNTAYLGSQPCPLPYFRPGLPCTTDFRVVLGENGMIFATDLKSVVALDATMAPLWTYSSASGMDLVAATADGGITINDFQQGLVPLDANGNAGTPSGSSLLAVTPWALGNWMGDPNGGLAEFAGPGTVLADSLWFSPNGNAESQNSSPNSDFGLVWCAQNGCSDLPDSNQDVSYFIQADDPPHTIINLTESQKRILQLNALNAFKLAFTPYRINVSSGRVGAHTVYIVGTGDSSCGSTDGNKISWSRVFYGTNMQEAQHAVGITTSTPTADQVNRIVQAIGEGIGNNAAHEVGHQLVIEFTRFQKIVAGMDMDDNSLGTYNGGSCTDPAVFTGLGADGHTPIHWSGNADQSLVNIFNRRQ